MIRLNYSHLLTQTRLPIETFSHFNYWFKPFPLNEFPVTCQHQATAFDVPFYDIFAPAKNFPVEVSDDVIACDLLFWPPPIENSGYAYGRPRGPTSKRAPKYSYSDSKVAVGLCVHEAKASRISGKKRFLSLPNFRP